MKGFIVFSCFVAVTLLTLMPFAIHDMGWFGLMVIIIGGAMPAGSAITGIWAWKHGKLDDIETIKKILHK